MKFVGIECAREALATEIHRQLKEDGCMCASCYFAHRTLARSVLRLRLYRQVARGISKDLRIFEDYWKKKEAEFKAGIKRGIENMRAGRVMTEEEFLKKHPWLE